MASAIVGRDVELASLHDFVGEISDGACAFVLEGEAGLGKTTLWSAGVQEADRRGLLIIDARPSESESTLSFSVVSDLLEPVLGDVLDRLVAAQRRALERALVLADDDGAAPDRHAVGVALLNALRALAERRPLIVAIDDVQWLDAASAGALAYAGRRLRSDQVGILLARRTPLESSLVTELRRSLPSARFVEVTLGPLDAAALYRVVHEQLGIALPRPLLAEVEQVSGGNPFYALEIARMLQRTGASVEAGHPLPVPESLHDLVNARLLALPADSRDFLLAAAAHAHPTVSITEAASRVPADAGLPPALESRIVELDHDRIRFTHPLLAAGAYETADPPRRREVHVRLAELLHDPEARAWQLAASTVRSDETIAASLEEAAWHARARGAPRPAALMLERARDLTPDKELGYRRGIDAAFLHFESGDSRRAEKQLVASIQSVDAGPARARALVRLARVRSYEAQVEAADLFLQTIEEAGDDETLATAHEGVAACLFRLRERLPEATEHAARAAELAARVGDEGLAAEATGTLLISQTLLGIENAAETAGRALALEDAGRGRRVLGQPLVALAVHWWWTDEAERARSALLELLERARETGDESSLPYVLVLLGRIECQLGEYASAAERAHDGQEAAEQSGQRALVAYNLALEALVAAHVGQVDRARQGASDALEQASDTGGRPTEHVAREALGQLELSMGAQEAAASWLEPAVSFARAELIEESGAARPTVDLVEALVELGRTDEAGELLDWYEGNARRLQRVSALANCLRCRGLLAAQTGALDQAFATFEEALRLHGQVEFPLDRGRTLLGLGATQRRMKRRREARATLEEALAIFERIGAALWAERARDELRRISGRAPAPHALTPAEERVAALVAQGKTNREVAAALFVSDRTVEGHLARIFGKLGIRHRTELAGALAASQRQGIEPSNTGDTPVSAESVAP